jgi:hypothetical protein
MFGFAYGDVYYEYFTIKKEDIVMAYENDLGFRRFYFNKHTLVRLFRYNDIYFID